MISYHRPKGALSQGPYTPAVEVVANGVKTLYVSGQGTYDPALKEKYLGKDIKRQATLSLANLVTILSGCGYSVTDLVKVTIFAISPDHLSDINEAYEEVFTDGNALPARSAVIVAGLPGGMAVEIEAVAVKVEG